MEWGQQQRPVCFSQATQVAAEIKRKLEKKEKKKRKREKRKHLEALAGAEETENSLLETTAEVRLP